MDHSAQKSKLTSLALRVEAHLCERRASPFETDTATFTVLRQSAQALALEEAKAREVADREQRAVEAARQADAASGGRRMSERRRSLDCGRRRSRARDADEARAAGLTPGRVGGFGLQVTTKSPTSLSARSSSAQSLDSPIAALATAAAERRARPAAAAVSGAEAEGIAERLAAVESAKEFALLSPSLQAELRRVRASLATGRSARHGTSSSGDVRPQFVSDQWPHKPPPPTLPPHRASTDAEGASSPRGGARAGSPRCAAERGNQQGRRVSSSDEPHSPRRSGGGAVTAAVRSGRPAADSPRVKRPPVPMSPVREAMAARLALRGKDAIEAAGETVLRAAAREVAAATRAAEAAERTRAMERAAAAKRARIAKEVLETAGGEVKAQLAEIRTRLRSVLESDAALERMRQDELRQVCDT